MAGPNHSLSTRFAFQSQLSSQGSAPRWLAVEAATGRRVVAAVVSAARVASLDSARGVQHRHLAGMIEVVASCEAADLPPTVGASAGSAVAIAEYVPGRALERQLAVAPLSPAKAVAWTLRLIDAVQALHQKGAVHGAISPWSVIAEPEGRAIAPALSQLLAPPVGAYCPPEKLKGSSDSPSDDVWALYATLYAAVTGKPPFPATERDPLRKQMMAGRPKPLSEFGLDEPALSEIVTRGLVGEKRLRASELGELSRALDGWERDPRAMPARRAPAPRPTTTRGVADLLAAPSATDDGIVFDGSSLTAAAPRPPLSPAVTGLPAVAAPPPLPVASVPIIHGPPPLPAVSAPPPLPVVSGPPPLPAVSAPPPLPVVSAPPPLPTVVSAPPPLPTVVSGPPPLSTTPALTAPLIAMPPMPPEAARVRAAPASLDSLVAELPPATAAPFPAVVAPVHPPAPRRLSFNPFEKKRKLWPIVVGAAAMGGLGMYVALGASGAQQSAGPVAAASTTAPAPKPRAPEKPKLSPSETRDICVRSYFPERAFGAGANLGSICEDGDFREVSKRLFTLVKQQPLAARSGAEGSAAADKLAADANANLGWYELPAAAIIRKSCCTSAAAVVLPETVGWCEQLQSAVRRIAEDSDKAGDLAPGARAFDKAVTCLYVHRINRPYTYERPPSEQQRREFQRFLSLAAISEARR